MQYNIQMHTKKQTSFFMNPSTKFIQKYFKTTPNHSKLHIWAPQYIIDLLQSYPLGIGDN